MAGRGKRIDKWRWVPSADACPACAALANQEYDECPGEPHPNCHCQCIKMEAQINPPGKKQPYQVGFQVQAEGTGGAPDRYTVAVTCMRPADGGDDGDDEGGGDDDEWEIGDTHTGDIDIPSQPNVDASSPEGIAAADAREEMLHDYAEGLYQNYCIGFA